MSSRYPAKMDKVSLSSVLSKKPTYTKYGYKKKTLAQEVAALKRTVGKEEWKYRDTIVASSINNTATIQCITLISQGDDVGNREGRKINIESIQAKIRWEQPNAAIIPATMRVIFFADKQSNAAAPVTADLLDTSTAGGVDALRQLNNRSRFKILMDRRYSMGTVSGGTHDIVDDYYDKRKHDVIFNATNGGTIADIQTGALWVLVVSDASANPPSTVINVRVRFTE